MTAHTETTTVRLLDAWKAKKGIDSDYKAAQELGVSRGTPSNWRNGQSHARPALAARMAQDLGLDDLQAMAAVEADRSHDGNDRRAWQRHGRALFAALVVGIAVTGPVQARHLQPVQTHQIGMHDPLCEIRRRRRYGGGYRPVGLAA